MRDERSNYGGWNMPFGPMAGPMQQWMCAVQAWTNAMSMFIPGAQQMFMGAGFPAAAPPVTVDVILQRPAEVATGVNLIPGAECMSLSVGTLTGQGAYPPLLDGVSISTGQGVVSISVPVGVEQPAGNYTGEIKSGDGRTAGNLTVVITELVRDRK